MRTSNLTEILVDGQGVFLQGRRSRVIPGHRAHPAQVMPRIGLAEANAEVLVPGQDGVVRMVRGADDNGRLATRMSGLRDGPG